MMESHVSQIVAALIRRGDEVLLVRQQGQDDPTSSWALPGGVVEAGELWHEALSREVREETGLTLRQPERLVYVAQLHNPPAVRRSLGEIPPPGGSATIAVFEVPAPPGEIRIDDPDSYVSECRFVGVSEAINLLENHPLRVVREPIVDHLRHPSAEVAVWLYRRDGDGHDQLVARLPHIDAAFPSGPPALRRQRQGSQGTPTGRITDPAQRSLEYQAFVLGCMAIIGALVVLIIIGIIASTGWRP